MPYNIVQYGGMIADTLRMDAYVRALRAVVRPETVLVDVGAGTGILALVACRLGAARVYAIEPNDAIHLLRETAAANGFSDRIVPIQEVSTRVTLPERADVLVSDLHGVLPAFHGHLAAIADAQARFLRAGAVTIPRRETLWMSVVEADEQYRRHVGGWDEPPLGLDLSPVRALSVNGWTKARLDTNQLLTEPRQWAELDYRQGFPHRFGGKASWPGAIREGAAHGLLVWFDVELADGIVLSNAPAVPELVYGAAFFPFERPVAVSPGHSIDVEVRAAPSPSDGDHLWSWRTRVRHGDEPEVSFDQSTFRSIPLSLERLHRGAASYTPRLGDEGELERYVLEAMDGSRTLREIAERATEKFPGLLTSFDMALARVSKLSQRFSR